MKLGGKAFFQIAKKKIFWQGEGIQAHPTRYHLVQQIYNFGIEKDKRDNLDRQITNRSNWNEKKKIERLSRCSKILQL